MEDGFHPIPVHPDSLCHTARNKTSNNFRYSWTFWKLLGRDSEIIYEQVGELNFESARSSQELAQAWEKGKEKIISICIRHRSPNPACGHSLRSLSLAGWSTSFP